MTSSMLLTPPELAACRQIQDYIAHDPMLDDIVRRCGDTDRGIRARAFAPTYAGILLAARGSIREARQVLHTGESDAFSRTLYKYLLNVDAVHPIAPIWEDVGAFDIWSHTPFSRQQTLITLDAVEHGSRSHSFPTPGKMPTIVDVGTGNGVLLADLVNRLAGIHGFRAARLVLIDSVDSAVESAADYCREHINVPVEVLKMCSPIEAVSASDLKAATGSPVWLVHAAATLHHLPRTSKVETFEKLGSMGAVWVITELEGNHDIPARFSPELAYSACQFYNCLIGDILSSDLPGPVQQECVNQFLLPEALAILFNGYENRMNYHMLQDEWLSVIEEAGGHATVLARHIVQPDGPCSMTISATFAQPPT